MVASQRRGAIARHPNIIKPNQLISKTPMEHETRRDNSAILQGKFLVT